MAAQPAIASDVPAAGVVNRIQTHLPAMSGTMRKIATLLLNQPQAPLNLSIGQLAEEAGTSPATVTRFCRLVGYSGYAALRVSIATDVGRTSARQTWTSDIGRAFRPDDAPRDVLSTLLNAHVRTLRETASVLDLDEAQEIARRIASCEHVDIYGVGSGAVLAEELEARFYRIGVNAHHWSEVHAGLTSAAILDENAVAIAISNTGRTEETIQMLTEAGNAGALTVAISNNPASPLVELADECLITSVYERFLQPDDLSAKHAQLFVLDLLYLLVAQADYDRTTRNLGASAVAVSSHRRPQRTRATAPAEGVAAR